MKRIAIQGNDPIFSVPLRQARIDLAAAHRMAVIDKFIEGTWNHMSVTVPSLPGHMLVTPADRHWKQVRASDIVVLNERGESVMDTGRCIRSAYSIHYPIHAARPENVCVIHVHPPSATALSMLKNGRLLMADQNALAVYGRVAYDDEYSGLVITPGAGRTLAEMLGDKRVLFLRNHGVIVVGPTLAEAYTDLYQLERACMLQLLAMSSGQELVSIPHAIATKAVKAIDDSGYKMGHFTAMKSLLDAEQPDYAS